MIHVIIVDNPFDRRQRRDYFVPFECGKKVSDYHKEVGEKVYAIDGIPCTANTVPFDGQEVVVMPYVAGGSFKKVFGWVAAIGITVLSAGVGAGIIGASTMSVWARLGITMALSYIGNGIMSKLTPKPKVDKSNTEQSNTYGWGEPQSITSQGYPLPLLYGRMKTAGIMLQRHVISNGQKQYLNILYCLAEGPVDAIENIQLNDNPITNYSDVQVEKRYGTNTQTVISNFNDSYSDTPLAYELKPERGWYTVKLDGNMAQAVELTIAFPAGLYYNNDKGGTDATSVRIVAQIRKVGTDTWYDLPIPNENQDNGSEKSLRKQWRRASNNGKTISWTDWYRQTTTVRDEGIIRYNQNNAFYRTYGFYDLTPAQYEVRMRCVSKDGTSIRYVNKVQWSAVTQVIYDDFIHPGKALLGIRALATDQLSGNDPQMTCEVVRNKVQVWNPLTSAYEEQPANNPAWAAYDLVHRCTKVDTVSGGTSYVVDGVSKDNMDYYAFKAWADACNKAKIEFNYLYDAAMTLWDALEYPCRVGHGAVMVAGTKFTCVYDYASEPVQLFTVANVKKDSLSTEYQSTDSRANAIEISFINKDKNYERDVLTVYGDSYDDDETTQQPTQIELMGCTSAQQAYKYGKYYLRSNKYEIRTVSFEAYVDAIACSIGDVILVQTDAVSWGLGGRIKAVEGTVLTLDQVPDAEYTTILIRDNATDKIYTTALTATDGTKVTVESTNGASAGAVYALGKTGNKARKFKVLTIDKGMQEQTRTITAVEYYDELYDSDGDVLPTIEEYDSDVPTPKNLVLTTESYVEADGTLTNLIHCAWVNPRQYARVKMEVSADGGNTWSYETEFKLGESSYTFKGLSLCTYGVRIYSTNDIGRESSKVTNYILTDGKDNPPPDIVSISTEQLSSGIRRFWWDFTYPYPNDISGFRLKYTQGKELNWGTGIPVQDGLVTQQPYETQAIRQGSHAIMIKAVDNGGNESKNFAYALLDVGDLIQENVIWHKDFKENSWSGLNHTGTVLSDGNIHPVNTTNMWSDANDYKWISDGSLQWKSSFKQMNAKAGFTAPVSGQFWLNVKLDGPALISYRKALNASAWNDTEDNNGFWPDDMEQSQWNNEASMWIPYSDRVNVKAGDMLEVNIDSSNGKNAQTIIKSMDAYVDVPDLFKHFEDIFIPVDGITLPIGIADYHTTAVRLDSVTDSTATMVKVISRTPCVVQLLDSTGKAVSGTADITWQGYRKELL